MSRAEVSERLRNPRHELDRLLGYSACDSMDSLVQSWSDGLNRKPLEGVDQRNHETLQPIAVLLDPFSFHLVQDLAHLLRRKFLMVQKRNEAGDGPLEINIVFPERVISINEQGLAHRFHCLLILAAKEWK